LIEYFNKPPETPKPVLPADLLAFFVGSTPVADADFTDPQSSFGHLDRDFWLKAKAVLPMGIRTE